MCCKYIIKPPADLRPREVFAYFRTTSMVSEFRIVSSGGTSLPDAVSAGIRAGILQFGNKIRGYDMGDAVLTAVESRTSSPVRILRDESMQSLTHRGVYPVGEGAGYAGGIVSSAVDGLRAAEAIISQFRPESP